LIARTEEKYAKFCVGGKSITIKTHGVKSTIIDFTFSRMIYKNSMLYCDLANDEDLFLAHGDYQFEVYRLMRERVK